MAHTDKAFMENHKYYMLQPETSFLIFHSVQPIPKELMINSKSYPQSPSSEISPKGVLFRPAMTLLLINLKASLACEDLFVNLQTFRGPPR